MFSKEQRESLNCSQVPQNSVRGPFCEHGDKPAGKVEVGEVRKSQ
jgi:hypothetical protein